MENEGEILRKYLKDNDISQTSLAEKLGISRQGLNYYLKKEKLDLDFKELLAKHGVKIFTSSTHELTPFQLGNQVVMHAPLVNQYAYAGYLAGYGDDEYMEDLPKIPWLVDKEHKGNYITFEVRNDSMNDGSVNSYLEGDKVLGREIARHLWRSKLHIDNWDFVIVHKTDGILLKKIAKHDINKGTLTLHSLNPLYEDFSVNLDDVLQIFNVVQVARKK